MASRTTSTTPTPPLDPAQREEAERQKLDEVARAQAEPAPQSAPTAFTYAWPVGSRTVTLTAPLPAKPGQMRHCTIAWAPVEPRSLSDAELRQYRFGRMRAAVSYGLQPLAVR